MLPANRTGEKSMFTFVWRSRVRSSPFSSLTIFTFHSSGTSNCARPSGFQTIHAR